MRRVVLLAPLSFALSACQATFTTTGTWSEAPAPPAATEGSQIAATADGRVVVLGGSQLQTGEPSDQTLVLDPTAGRWTQAAPIPEPRTDDVAVPLADGTLLVTAGQAGNGQLHQLYRSTWIYDPARDRWNRVGDLDTARLDPSAVRLTDGRVLLAGGSIALDHPLQLANGGQELFQPVASAEIYDPSTKTWSKAGGLSVARSGLALVALPHNSALAVGGCPQGQPGFNAIATTELFNPVSDRWSLTTPLPEPRCIPSGIALADGRVLVVGGVVNQPNGFGNPPTALVFDSRTGSWTSEGSAVASGSFPNAGPAGIAPPAPFGVLLRDGSVFLPAIQPGPTRGHVTTTVVGGQLFRPSTGGWAFATSTAIDFASRFGNPTPVPVALPSGRVVVLLESVALVFDPQGNPPPAQALDNLSLTWLLLGINGVLLLLLAMGLLRVRRFWKRRPTVPA